MDSVVLEWSTRGNLTLKSDYLNRLSLDGVSDAFLHVTYSVESVLPIVIFLKHVFNRPRDHDVTICFVGFMSAQD